MQVVHISSNKLVWICKIVFAKILDVINFGCEWLKILSDYCWRQCLAQGEWKGNWVESFEGGDGGNISPPQAFRRTFRYEVVVWGGRNLTLNSRFAMLYDINMRFIKGFSTVRQRPKNLWVGDQILLEKCPFFLILVIFDHKNQAPSAKVESDNHPKPQVNWTKLDLKKNKYD